jgi:hypothetical protein
VLPIGTNGGFPGQVQPSVVLKVPNPVSVAFIPCAAYRHQRGISRTSATLRSVEVPNPVLTIGTNGGSARRVQPSVVSKYPSLCSLSPSNGGFPGQVQRSVVLKVPNPVLAITIKRGFSKTSATLRSVESTQPLFALRSYCMLPIDIYGASAGQVQRSVVLKVPNPVSVAFVLYSAYQHLRRISRTNATLRSVL